MKKKIIYLLLITIGFSAVAFQAKSDCDIRALKNELLKGLKPDFKYDSYKATRFIYKNEEQTIEIFRRKMFSDLEIAKKQNN